MAMVAILDGMTSGHIVGECLSLKSDAVDKHGADRAPAYLRGMGSKRQSRLKVIAPTVARLRALNMTVVSNGRTLAPGTDEYERYLEKSAGFLSEEELASMEAHGAKGS